MKQSEKSFVRKKKTVKLRLKMPGGLIHQEFWSEYNFCVFVQKHVNSIFRGPQNEWKNL